MFTGIVETIGTVSAVTENDTSPGGGGGTSLTISDAGEILGDARLGDSISVNGTCLTITHLTPTTFTVGISPETLRRTNLHTLQAGDGDGSSSAVNLERALTPQSRMGGHMVQGHVDTVATIAQRRADGNAVVLRLRPRDRAVLAYVVEKGFVALDGVSLTVTGVGEGEGEGEEEEGWWEVMLVTYTQERVVLARKEVGESVNVEVDMVGKYVEKGVRAYFEGGGGAMAGLVERVLERVVREKLEEKEGGGR
ncbi:MAG: Riboflavin synthase alpha chain [Geoglossum umbratile]|nr:MAG: Riboflavin synthase alpha chain [Geoglossum umbratile]